MSELETVVVSVLEAVLIEAVVISVLEEVYKH